MKKISQILLFASSLVLSGGVAHAIALNTDSSNWDAIEYGPDNQSDYWADQQTGQSGADIVGSADDTSPGFFKQYDTGVDALDLSDDEIAFRVRLAADGNPSGFTKYIFVGLDVGSDGNVDVFIRANQDGVSFYAAGDGANVSPSSSSLQALVSDGNKANLYEGQNVDWDYAAGDSNFNVDFSPVTVSPTDINGDGTETDYYFSFSVDVATLLKAIVVSELINDPDDNYVTSDLTLATSVSFVAATSVNGNNLNQDIGGIDDKNSDLSLDWITLGATSLPYTPDGATAVPEPSSYALLFGLLAGGFVLTRRRR